MAPVSCRQLRVQRSLSPTSRQLPPKRTSRVGNSGPTISARPQYHRRGRWPPSRCERIIARKVAAHKDAWCLDSQWRIITRGTVSEVGEQRPCSMIAPGGELSCSTHESRRIARLSPSTEAYCIMPEPIVTQQPPHARTRALLRWSEAEGDEPTRTIRLGSPPHIKQVPMRLAA